MTNTTTIAICTNRNTAPAQQTLEQALIDSLSQWPGLKVIVLPHLYDLAPTGPAIRRLQSLSGDLIVLAWLYPRAAYWILDANGIRGRWGRSSSSADQDADPTHTDESDRAKDLPDRTIWCLDLRQHNQVDPLLEELARIVEHSRGEPAPAVDPRQRADVNLHTCVQETTQARWYPVVDYDRCQNCLDCLNFCLFGVFGVDASGRLLVEQPDACRDGCPACSRVCPSRAIMFPQHSSPAIAGDPHASADGLDLSLLQLFDATGSLGMPASERDRVPAQHTATGTPTKTPSEDDLDRLVDELDKLDL
jgi:NAD-dependent dihydropyrimidine dehydrogenase PreA subunit